MAQVPGAPAPVWCPGNTCAIGTCTWLLDSWGMTLPVWSFLLLHILVSA